MAIEARKRMTINKEYVNKLSKMPEFTLSGISIYSSLLLTFIFRCLETK